jgi:methanogenic corrinoid protein MtbC1
MSMPKLPPVEPDPSDRQLGETLSPELLASLLADGDDELAAWTLRQAMTDANRVDVYGGLLADAMRLVGERWVTGQWSVAEEHLASQTLLRALDRIRPDLGPESRIGPLAVLAGVAGEHHMIGLVCLDHVLRERGWTVANLGADVPAADLGRFVERNEARLVAITASDPARTDAVRAAVDAVRSGSATASPAHHIPILLGGRLASDPAVGETLGIDWHGASLAEATSFADGVLASLSTAET